jgi:hypothetical protein
MWNIVLQVNNYKYGEDLDINPYKFSVKEPTLKQEVFQRNKMVILTTNNNSIRTASNKKNSILIHVPAW